MFATADFQPAWCEAGKPRYEEFQVAATLRSQDGGAMETSLGIGAAVIVVKDHARPLHVAATVCNWPASANVRLPSSASTTWRSTSIPARATTT